MNVLFTFILVFNLLYWFFYLFFSFFFVSSFRHLARFHHLRLHTRSFFFSVFFFRFPKFFILFFCMLRYRTTPPITHNLSPVLFIRRTIYIVVIVVIRRYLPRPYNRFIILTILPRPFSHRFCEQCKPPSDKLVASSFFFF